MSILVKPQKFHQVNSRPKLRSEKSDFTKKVKMEKNINEVTEDNLDIVVLNSDDETYDCDMCEETFWQMKWLESHRYSAHGLMRADDPKVELMMKISELEEQLTNAKHQEDLKVKDIEAKHDEKMQEMQKQISDLTTENQEHLDLMENHLDFVKREKVELLMKISELEEQLTNAKHQEDLKVKDIEAKHDKKMQEIQKQISDLTTENQEHLDLMEFVKCEKEELANENEELKSKLKQLNVNLNNMESKNDEDTSLLDLLGVEEITEDISGDGIPRRNKKAKVQSEIADDNKHVKASGSGSGFVSYLDSSEVDENDDMDDYEIESSLKDSNVSSAIMSKSIKRNTSNFEEIENRLRDIPIIEKKLLMNLKPLQFKVQKQFICEICEKIFTSNFNKKTHIKNVHEQIKEYKCEICGKLFGQLSNKKKHLNVHKYN